MSDGFMERWRPLVEEWLGRLLPAEADWPGRLVEAMRYAVLGGGKRVRPLLAMASYAALGGDPSSVVQAACGVEFIHCYSLVHDDLPEFDNDELRRGRPTVHVEFGADVAILVGDALLTEGLRVLAEYPEGEVWASKRAQAVAAVAGACSWSGLVGGQAEDKRAEYREGQWSEAWLQRIHRGKTGSLLSVCAELGAIWMGASDEVRGRLRRWGMDLGLAFQMADDLLDASATAEEVGKATGKDAASGKLTAVTLLGEEGARARLRELNEKVIYGARELDGGTGPLSELADFLASRRR